ncbi:probable G-protein coupled receptor 139 [Ylistrum balloti]|uniref:probable G-protein coupled receptor 139 n=1 Tax=Ylistrum balloti TaxID=509963 RepID=UPI00290594DB|nr:probable G-protein coupled receptor 139 [Ylistrum balloti]
MKPLFDVEGIVQLFLGMRCKDVSKLFSSTVFEEAFKVNRSHILPCSKDGTSATIFDFVYNLLKNSGVQIPENTTTPNCTSTDVWLPQGESVEAHMVNKAGRMFFAYVTPIILFIGILGNCLSLNVFLSKNMRGLSASTYLAAISSSDLLTLIFYVNVEWLRRGLVYLNSDVQVKFLDTTGVCQFQLYMSYVSRFLSAWLVVAFTVERYIGVCHPLRRRDICTPSSTRRIIITTSFVAVLLVIYKPVLSGVHNGSSEGHPYCTSDPSHDFLSFVLDSIFAVLITLVPFLFITVLNVLIIRKLFIRNKRQKECKVVTEESVIKLEFTVILLAISFCFVVFNVPFFAVWCRNFLHSKYVYKSVEQDMSDDIEYWQGILYITRTIFYMNYCINFFLYSITGAYFRREVRMLFVYRPSELRGSYSRCSRINSNSHTPQSWV